MPGLPSWTGRDEPGWRHMATLMWCSEKWPMLPVWLLHPGNIPSPLAGPTTSPPQQHLHGPSQATHPSEPWASLTHRTSEDTAKSCSGRARTEPLGGGAGDSPCLAL